MSEGPRILAFAGSTRAGSVNRRLLRAGAEAVKAAGMDCTLIELADYPLPIYNGDLEAGEGLPDRAAELRELFLSHQGLLIAAPEYNSSITPLLKNTIDWVSRAPGARGDLSPYRGKVAALLSASPGALGGLRGLVTVRSILSNIGVLVIPQQYALSQAGEQFDEAGRLPDGPERERVASVAAALADWVRRAAAHPRQQ